MIRPGTIASIGSLGRYQPVKFAVWPKRQGVRPAFSTKAPSIHVTQSSQCRSCSDRSDSVKNDPSIPNSPGWLSLSRMWSSKVGSQAEVIRLDGLRQMDVVERKLKAAIEGQHGGTAHLAYIDAVSQTRQDRPVEGGLVFVFDLEGHPEAARAYGWTSLVGEDDERRFHVVLQVPPIATAQDAVRSITLADSRDDWSRRVRELSGALLQQLARLKGQPSNPSSGPYHQVSAPT